MKKFILSVCMVLLLVIAVDNDTDFKVQYSLILENPPIGYSPFGDPVIVAQGILDTGKTHVIGSFKDCPNPEFRILWETEDRVVQNYEIPIELNNCDLLVLSPQSFTVIGCPLSSIEHQDLQ